MVYQFHLPILEDGHGLSVGKRQYDRRLGQGEGAELGTQVRRGQGRRGGVLAGKGGHGRAKARDGLSGAQLVPETALLVLYGNLRHAEGAEGGGRGMQKGQRDVGVACTRRERGSEGRGGEGWMEESVHWPLHAHAGREGEGEVMQ